MARCAGPSLSHPSPSLDTGRDAPARVPPHGGAVQNTHLAARRTAARLRPGPASLAAQARPLPIRPHLWGLRVAGRVDGAGRVHRTPPGKGSGKETRPW